MRLRKIGVLLICFLFFLSISFLISMNSNQLNDDNGEIQALNGAPPLVTYPDNITTTTIGTENITWTITNQAGTYRVFANDTNGDEYVWQDWTAWVDGVPFDITINRTAVGVFNYTLACNNSFGSNTSTVFVTVTLYTPPPTSPAPLTLGELVFVTTIIVGPAGAIVGIAVIVARKRT